MANGKRVLLIVSGGIAAYKVLELIRLGRPRGLAFRAILTAGGARFVTPLSISALTGEKVHADLFSLTEESEMGHIRLAREADLIVVAPASADILAKMAHGRADDLATATLLASNAKILIAPAMNGAMWEHPATKANIATLRGRGIAQIGPRPGDLACGETGNGRLAEPVEILAAIETLLGEGPLKGLRALVTSGPTYEAVDPVRFIGNRSSGRQGHAIAAALAGAGAETFLIAGPTHEPDPLGCHVRHVESAEEMLAASLDALPADIAICAAAVSDWKAASPANRKLKKRDSGPPPTIALVPNPDILATLSEAGRRRPRLVVGFAAETENVVEYATQKRLKKGCDWILANDVSPETGTFGGPDNLVHFISAAGVEDWPRLSKTDVAARLVARIARHFEKPDFGKPAHA